MYADMRFTASITMHIEVSEDGHTWAPSAVAPVSRETVHSCAEFDAVVRAYVNVICTAGAEVEWRKPWFRVVAQGDTTRMILAVMPRRWDGTAYVPTGGDWTVTDLQSTFQIWAARFLTAKLASPL
ncbi:hypothetical protein CPT_Shaeky_064 [Streptomyces phage Shaeky]|uniref:Uncharacterized protein n=1 Tax=Streptomyces phage Shaeky TaxID=2767586 RepID=A0A873WQ07_9CAUD|nr:hypothetical protein CPT_Shaeky_064 [Streptomyces phage Shaeky]